MSLSRHVARLCIALAMASCAATASADVVAVVSSQSAVSNLTRSQVSDIFLGKARRFPNGVAAVPIDQAVGSAAREEFYETFASKSPAQLKAHWSKIIFTGRGQPPAAISDSTELKKRIAADPTAIGYLDRTQLDASVREIR